MWKIDWEYLEGEYTVVARGEDEHRKLVYFSFPLTIRAELDEFVKRTRMELLIEQVGAFLGLRNVELMNVEPQKGQG